MTGSVGKQNDFARRLFDCSVLRRGFAETYRLTEQLYAAMGKFADNIVRSIRRTIRSNNDLERLARIIELKRVLKLRTQVLLFVVCRQKIGLHPALSRSLQRFHHRHENG